MYAKKATTVEFAAGYKPWHGHVDLEGRCGGSNLRFQCIYCGNSYTGAKSRLVQHLAGTKKGIGGYASAPQTAKDWAETQNIELHNKNMKRKFTQEAFARDD